MNGSELTFQTRITGLSGVRQKSAQSFNIMVSNLVCVFRSQCPFLSDDEKANNCEISETKTQVSSELEAPAPRFWNTQKRVLRISRSTPSYERKKCS